LDSLDVRHVPESSTRSQQSLFGRWRACVERLVKSVAVFVFPNSYLMQQTEKYRAGGEKLRQGQVVATCIIPSGSVP
jgi:hypothetical protein